MVFGRLVSWLEQRSRWNHLSSLGNSGLVKASVLMPAFGYILLLNDNVHQYLTIKYDGWLLHYLPSIWRVWLLFYGTFLLSIGSILFSSFCLQMADAERFHIAHQHLVEQLRQRLETIYNGLSKWELSLLPRRLAFKHPTLGVTTSDLESTMSIYVWSLQANRRPLLRIIVLFLFGSGLTLLAVPATITLVQVTLLPVRHLFS
jgi:hypothetical protein